MLTTLREIQLPLLVGLLLGSCTVKAWRTLRPRPGPAGLGPTGLFPLRLRHPVMIIMYVTELSLGLGLAATAGRVGDVWLRVPATIVRMATALFFLIAVGALNETRQRRPDSGCGCFGDLSDTPIGLRTIARAAVLAASAAATIGVPALRMPPSFAAAELWLAVLAARAGPDGLPVARTRRGLGPARLFGALRASQAAGRPDHVRLARELSVAQVRGSAPHRRAG